MRLQFVTIGQNLNWPRGRLSLARKKNLPNWISATAAQYDRNALYSNQNDDTSYEICDAYVKLSIDFHPMAIFLGNKEVKFLPGKLVILCIISSSSMLVHGHFLVK